MLDIDGVGLQPPRLLNSRLHDFSRPLVRPGNEGGNGSVAGILDAVDIEDGITSRLKIQADDPQHLTGDAFLRLNQAEKKVAGADDVVLQLPGDLIGELEDQFGPGGKGRWNDRALK